MAEATVEKTTADEAPAPTYVIYVVKGANIAALNRLLGLANDPEDQTEDQTEDLDDWPPLGDLEHTYLVHRRSAPFELGRRYRLSDWERRLPRNATIEKGVRGARYLIYNGEPNVKAWLTGRKKRQTEYLREKREKAVA